MNDFYEFLSKSLASLLVLLFGLIGNLIGLAVFSRRNLSKFPTKNLYRSLALFDTIYLVYRIIGEVTTDNGMSIYLISNIWCKVFRYFRYSLGPISAWVLVYISIEKFISIQFSKLKVVVFQNTIIILIVIFNLSYYSPFFVYSTLIAQNNTDSDMLNSNSSSSSLVYTCYFQDLNQKKVLYMMDLVNSTLLPFALMIVFSTFLIHTIFKSRLRILRLDSSVDRKRLRKDIKFAFTCILLNMAFVILNLPVCIANLLTEVSEFTYKVLLYLFFLSFCINFYVLFTFNSIFRKEFLLMFNFIPSDHRLIRNSNL